MADYTPVASQAKPQQQMSLADMVNMANAVQGYQQAQQLNPVQLETARTQLSRLQQFTPLETRLKEAEAKKAEGTLQPSIDLATQQAENARIEGLKAQYGLNAQEHDDFAKILGGFQYDKRLDPLNLKDNPNDAVEVMHDIRAQAKAKGIREKSIDVITAPGMAKAMQNPSTFPDYLKNMTATGMTAAEQRAAGLEKTEVTPSGQLQRTTPAIYGKQQQVSIEQPQGNTPMQGTVKVNGLDYFVSPPKTPNGLPTLTLVGQGQNAPAQPKTPAPTTQPSTSTVAPSAKSSLVKEDMPVPQGNIRQMNEQQKGRYTVGQQLFSDAATGNQTAADQGIILNSIKETLSQAQSSKPGQLLRQGGKYLAGNEKLDTLLKDLAQNQLLQAKMMGGVDSVNAQNTVSVANGSADIDPKALAKIVERTDATRLAAQMYNQGLSAYKSKDPLNSAIHADNFQQSWKSNYDPRIFMVENINASNASPEEKQKQIKRIIGMATPAELQQLKQKATNIRRLQTGDF
jgi:hypothetical protein